MTRSVYAVAATVAIGLVLTASAGAAAPETTFPPAIQGTPIVGKMLRAGNGQWRNNPTNFAYQWLRCDSKGNNCSKIAGETDRTYHLTNADLGHTILVLVTASNRDGDQTANSHPTDVVTRAIAPAGQTPPAIAGTPIVGGTLSADAGSYTGGAVGRYLFQWRRCDAAGEACVDIVGATGQTYGVRNADEGRTLRVEVTARNPYGSTVNESKATAVVKPRTAPAVTTTLTASRSTTICCQTVRLSGRVSSGKAGEPITVLARPFDDDVDDIVTKATAGANGDWTAVVTPTIETTYTVQTSTTKSQAVTVAVHPRVGFGIRGNNFSAKITGRDTFAGAVAYFQVQTNGVWRTRAVIVVDRFSVARFRVPLKKGRTYTVRIYLPQRQAGPGYLDGASHTRRVGGAA
jgi:hypothetical protein